MNKTTKIFGGVALIAILAVGALLVSGNNQQVDANEGGSVSINLEFSEIMLLVKTLMGSEEATQSEEAMLGSGTRYPNGISADTTSPSSGEVRGTTLTITGATTFGGLMTLNAGQLKSYTNSTSTTATTQTLTQADLLNYDSMLLTLNVGSATLTLPATSTMTSMVPNAGDVQEILVYNATSTADTYITWAAGAGINLQTSSSTASSLTQNNETVASLKFLRLPTATGADGGDVSVSLTVYNKAD